MLFLTEIVYYSCLYTSSRALVTVRVKTRRNLETTLVDGVKRLTLEDGLSKLLRKIPVGFFRCLAAVSLSIAWWADSLSCSWGPLV